MNRIIKFILFCLGFFLLFALIYRVGFSEIIKAVSGAKLYFVFSGVLAYLIIIFIRSYKWFLLTRTFDNTIKYKRFVPLYLVNSLIGNLTPFKLGETGTPFLFRKYLKISVGQGFSVIILDRFFELITFNIILVSAVFYILNSGIQNSLISSVFKGVLIALFLLLAGIITIIISKRVTLKLVSFFRLLRFVERELDNFYNALSLFKNKRVYQLIIPLTLIGWFLEFLAFYLVFSSVFSAPFINIAVSHVIAIAATFVTFIPAGVGIGEVSVVSVLSLFNYPAALTAGGAILADLFLTGTLLITGLAGSIFIKHSLGDAQRPGGTSQGEKSQEG